MNIKNLVKVFTLAVVMTIAFSYQSSAATTPAAVTVGTPADKAKDDALAAHIIQRVNEINDMDKTNLSPSEKKELRSELKDLKKQADGLDKRVYLSIGAIIIIILLLILILR